MKNIFLLWIEIRWILIFSLLTPGMIVKAQTTTLNYTIDVDGVNVGHMQAIKEIDEDDTTITINSNSTIHFLGTHEITTSIVAVINDGLLKSSIYKSKKNDNLYESIIITEKDGVYHINQQGNSNTITRPIKRPTCELYFEEPNFNESYFDVTTADFNPVERTGLNTFTYTDQTNKKETTYIYSNNLLLSGTTSYTWFKYSFTRTD